MKLIPSFQRKPTPTPEPSRDEDGKFVKKTGTKVKEVSELAGAVREILDVSREIQALGSETTANQDDVLLNKGLDLLIQAMQNNQAQPQQQPQNNGESDLPEELATQFKERYGKKLGILKRAVSRDEFELIVKLVKSFKSQDIINLIYGEKD